MDTLYLSCPHYYFLSLPSPHSVIHLELKSGLKESVTLTLGDWGEQV